MSCMTDRASQIISKVALISYMPIETVVIIVSIQSNMQKKGHPTKDLYGT